VIDLVKAAPHIRLHRGQTFVVKAGGATIAKPAAMRAFARQVAVIQALGSRVVVVHGGGPQIDAVQRSLGEEPRKVDGRRVTTPAALRALRFSTRGEIHSDLTAALLAEGVPAAGVGGEGILLAERRPPMSTTEGPVDFGAVGDLREADPLGLEALVQAGSVPVVAPLAHDAHGNLLNVNADLAAAKIAQALRAAKLVLVTETPGILRDVKDMTSLISALSLAELAELRAAGALRDGMAVKADAIAAALEGGVGRVHVVSGSDPEALLIELYTNHGIGTLVTAEPERAPEPLTA
jgi:acetylglutamate kinase